MGEESVVSDDFRKKFHDLQDPGGLHTKLLRMASSPLRLWHASLSYFIRIFTLTLNEVVSLYFKFINSDTISEELVYKNWVFFDNIIDYSGDRES